MTTPIATDENSGLFRGRRLILLLVLPVFAGAGCTAIGRLVEYPFQKLDQAVASATAGRTLNAGQLEDQLMRFADSYHSAVIGATMQLREHGKPPDPMRLLHMKLRYSEDLYAVVTGPNPMANLLDLIVVVTMTRMQLQDYWMPKEFGTSAATLIAVLQQKEKAIWELAADVLTPQERRELRTALRAWHEQNREMKTLDEIRATGFASAIAEYGKAESTTSGSVFDLLDLDPLSALDPATREIARTRHFGERVLFLAQRMPMLLRWQSELLAISVARLPEVQKALDNSTRLSDAADRLGQSAQQLPADIARERQSLVDALHSQSGALTVLATRARGALQAGADMAKSTDAALQTFDRIEAQLRAGSPDPNAPPFRIIDYKETAAQVAATAAQINEVLESLETLAGTASTVTGHQALDHLAEDIERRGDRLIDRLIRAGAVLIGLACFGLLAVLLAYRLLERKLTARAASRS